MAVKRKAHGVERPCARKNFAEPLKVLVRTTVTASNGVAVPGGSLTKDWFKSAVDWRS